MARLEIEGQTIEVDDSFLQMSRDEQNATVQQIASQLKVKPAKERTLSGGDIASVNVLRGIPIVGAYGDNIAAGLEAAFQPVLQGPKMSKAPTLRERYEENKKIITPDVDDYNRENPIKAGGAQLAGGVISMAPLGASAVVARALGMSGTLPQMVVRGGLSGAAIGGADAAARGDDVTRGAVIGGATGSGFPVVGRGIGEAVRYFRGTSAPPRPMPKNTTAGVDVDVWPVGDNADESMRQAAINGSLGREAQIVAQEAVERKTGQLQQAGQNFSNQLDTMRPPDQPPPLEPTTPHAAGGQVITELAARRNAEMQARALQGIEAEASDLNLRTGMAPGPATELPPTAYDAAEMFGTGVARRAQEAAGARTAAYQRAGEVEGVFNPAGFERISTSLEQRLNAGAPETRVRINDRTPLAREALDVIENQLGSGRIPTNQIDPRVRGYRGALEDGVQQRPIPPITGRDVESVRQQLVPLMRDANNKARGPMPDATDARAMRRVMEAFDDHVRDVVRAGGFSGDGAELLRRQAAARMAHTQYRGMYSARGQGDVVGPIIERIIGKHPGQAMTPDQIAGAMYGPAASPGGGNTVAVAQRLRNIVGEQSEEWAAAKQGLLSHLLDNADGVTRMTPAQQADRIFNFVNGTKGRALAQVYFSPEEIGRLTQHAETLRRLVPAGRPLTDVDRQIMRLSGADGYEPASTRTAVDMLFGADGTKGSADQLARRLKQTLSPESWDGVRQGMWTHLTSKPEGMIDFGPQAISQRIHKFLSEPIAATMYSPQERQMMRIIAGEYKSMIPPPNTTNPSGSGVHISKMLRAAQGNLLPMLGLATNGPAGVIGGYAADKALTFASSRRAVEQTKDLFYGKAPKGTKAQLNRNFERAAAILAKAAQPLTVPAPAPSGR